MRVAARKTEEPNGRSPRESTTRSNRRDRRQQGVDRPRHLRDLDDVDGPVAAAGGDLAGGPLGREHREDRREAVGGPLDAEPGPLHRRDGPALRVAAVVAVRDVEVGPRPGVGRHRHEEAPSGAQHAPDLGEGHVLGVAVLDDVEGRHDVERAVGEGQGEGGAAHPVGPEPARVDVEGGGAVDGVAQPGGARAVGAAEVEGRPGPLDEVAQRDLEQVGPGHVPPVAGVLDGGRTPVAPGGLLCLGHRVTVAGEAPRSGEAVTRRRARAGRRARRRPTRSPRGCGAPRGCTSGRRRSPSTAGPARWPTRRRR